MCIYTYIEKNVEMWCWCVCVWLRFFRIFLFLILDFSVWLSSILLHTHDEQYFNVCFVPFRSVLFRIRTSTNISKATTATTIKKSQKHWIQIRVWVRFFCRIPSPFPVGFVWHFLQMKPFPIVRIVASFFSTPPRTAFIHSELSRRLNNIAPYTGGAPFDFLSIPWSFSSLRHARLPYSIIFIFYLTTVYYVNQMLSPIYLCFFLFLLNIMPTSIDCIAQFIVLIKTYWNSHKKSEIPIKNYYYPLWSAFAQLSA